jgi:flagellar assembly protein FliH
MFSSDPFAIAAPIDGVRPRVLRPAVLRPDEMLAFNASLTTEWMPVAMEATPAFDALPDFGDDDDESTQTSAPAPIDPVQVRIDAAVREALEARDIEEMAIREQLQAEAYEAGIGAGRDEAEVAARQAFTTAIEALWLAAEEVRTSEQRWLGALQDNVAALAAASARHIVGREIAADDTLVRRLAALAVAEFPQDHPIHVRVNPADLATLREAFETPPARSGDLRWTADARVERGGCVVEGRDRIVDGRVDTALERIYRAVSGHHA